MKRAHYKTLRESMGMTREWVASMLGVNPRSAAYWESPKMKDDVPEHVEEFILYWWNQYQEKIDIILDKVRETRMEYGEPQGVQLSRYVTTEQGRGAIDPMTKEMHAALLGHITMALENEGYEVEIDFFPIDTVS